MFYANLRAMNSPAEIAQRLNYIPTFNLYGEEQDWPTPDLLHWESVAERSAIHQWTIKPHRHGNLWQLIYLSEGSASAHIDGREHQLTLPCLVLIPPLCVHGFEFSANIDGHVVTLAAPLIKELSNHLGDHLALFQLSTVVEVNAEQIPNLDWMLNNISQEYKTNQPHREFSLQTWVSQLLLWLIRNGFVSNQAETKKTGNGEIIYRRFMQLVENKFRDHLPLDQYAKTLSISTPHLNNLCRQYAKRSALQLIHQRLLLEAKRNLIYTAMTASEISYNLGFSEPAYFTRFFKRLSGSTPVEFRKKQ